MTLTQIKPAGLSTPVDLADNEKIRLGTSNDLQIYHDGNNSVITAGGAGDLQLTSTFDDVIIQAADNIFINPQGGENGLKVYGDGAVKLYYDGSTDPKLETLSTGVQVNGKLHIDRTVSATSGDHPALEIETLSSGSENSTFATGIDFRVDGVAKKRLAITRGSGEGGGDWVLFKDNGVNQAVVIDSSGRIRTGGASSFNASTNADDLQIGASGQANQTGISLGSAVASSLRFIDVANDSAGYILYNHGNDELTVSSTTSIAFSAGGGNAVNIDSNKNLQIAVGDLKVASGRGIDFSAVSDGSRTIHSNIFDDYEEGTWTPTIGGSTTQGSATMATQAGKYVKAGKLVTVSCYIGWNSFTGSGALNIYGLPFTCWNDAHAGAVMTKDLTFPSGAFYLSTHTWANVSYFRLYSSASNATWNYVTCDSTGNLICTMTYFAS